MLKDLFEFSCPCCGKRIELDLRTGRSRAVKPEEKKGGKDLDSLLADQKHEGQRLGTVFDKASDQQRTDKQRLQDLFESAKEDTKKEKDAPRPRNPFEME
jgi:hypothetical protein